MTASDRTLKARRYYLLPLAIGIGFTAIASATHAFELADGTYETNQDNGVGVLTILDGQAKLAISGPGCVGGLEGPLRRAADGQVSFGQIQGSASCEVMQEQSDEGLAWLSPGRGCSYFHGASCSFAGLVVGRTVAFSSSAVDYGFGQLDDSSRRAVQRALQDAGYYGGVVVGISGPGTRGAIHDAGKAAVARGDAVRLDSVDDVRAFLTGLIEAEPITTQSFFGTWDCEGSTYVFGPDGYRTHPTRDPLAYREVKEFTPGNFGVTFVDGYRLGLMDVTDRSMIWSSPASGDVFECSKEDPAVEEDSAIQRETIAAVVTTDPASDKQAEMPFHGRWTCVSDGMGELNVELSESSLTVRNIVEDLAYDEVIGVGLNGTAYRIEFSDGDMAHVFEASEGHMLLYVFGDVSECKIG